MRCHIKCFPENLRKIMETLGMDQCQFSKRIGITQAAMSQLLSGQRDPAAVTLMKIHAATGCSIDKLLGLK